ncbi:CDP-alcohol phosphatidyltransferase family protein [Patescibacteria group bacterium]|nr:CDP-alcohol phosphatidyltransferase family protein [Patescibacteria group bacterium]
MNTKFNIKELYAFPNLISYTRIIIAVYIVVASFFPTNPLYVQVFYFYGMISDKMDGIIARKFKLETYFGGHILEPIADGLLITSGFFFMVFRTDIPPAIVITAATILIIGVIASIAYIAKYKRPYDIHNIDARTGVLFAHILVVFFIFDIPYRIEVAYVIMGIGAFLLVDFIRRLLANNRQVAH